MTGAALDAAMAACPDQHISLGHWEPAVNRRDMRRVLEAAEPHLTAAGPGEPLLGCATTRELLLEIKARGETEPLYEEEGNAMAIGAANLIDMLPGSMLDYRTVDSD